jgi:hypothetical protein
MHYVLEHFAVSHDKYALIWTHGQTASGEEALARARLEAAKELSMVKVEMAGTSKDLAATYDSKLGSMREEGDARRKAEVQAIEDAKAAEIQVAAQSCPDTRGQSSKWPAPLFSKCSWVFWGFTEDFF